MKRLATLAGVLFSALLVSQAVADLRACEGAVARKDWATALRECRPVAERGDATAQFLLGVMYDHGRGVPQDHREAARWYRLAAEQGTAEAQYNLGVMYYKGESVPEDDLLAYFWLNLAASRADTTDRTKFVKAGDLVVKRLTPAQRAKAQEMARDWKPKPERPAEPTPGK